MKIFLSLLLNIYYKTASLFAGFKIKSKNIEFAKFNVNFTLDNFLETPLPQLRKLNPVYVLIRNLSFHTQISVNKMSEFKTLLKWHVLNLINSIVVRTYPLGFSARLKTFDKPKLALKLPPKVLFIDKKDFHTIKNFRIHEEIVKVLPYVRKADKKIPVKIPVIKRPLYKYTFSREQMKLFREKVAQQNKTSWLNIEIFEIYDKFYTNFYSNIKQTPGSNDLECYLSLSAEKMNPKKNYYLVIGQRRDTGQSIKAIVDPSDIKIV
ncbi:MAG TPA: hypothetical protein P5556_05430 [Candidatus Gastranaerophilales bacterium]|nr:hypothetical protein [Candidatus Gastranaerophilales bacterium]